MSVHPLARWCADCTIKWGDKPLDERKKSVPARATTVVAGTPLCTPCAKRERSKGRIEEHLERADMEAMRAAQ